LDHGPAALQKSYNSESWWTLARAISENTVGVVLVVASVQPTEATLTSRSTAASAAESRGVRVSGLSVHSRCIRVFSGGSWACGCPGARHRAGIIALGPHNIPEVGKLTAISGHPAPTTPLFCISPLDTNNCDAHTDARVWGRAKKNGPSGYRPPSPELLGRRIRSQAESSCLIADSPVKLELRFCTDGPVAQRTGQPRDALTA